MLPFYEQHDLKLMRILTDQGTEYCGAGVATNTRPTWPLKTLKTEGVYSSKFENQKSAARAIFEFIKIWYNRERLHSSLGYRTPAQMEELLNQQPLAA